MGVPTKVVHMEHVVPRGPVVRALKAKLWVNFKDLLRQTQKLINEDMLCVYSLIVSPRNEISGDTLDSAASRRRRRV